MTVTNEIKKIENIFDKFNEVFYAGELTRPVITYTADRTNSSYGWCSCDKVWYEGENKGYEINISANTIKYSNRGGVYSTLLHEMAHLYNNEHGIEDCSNNNFYHNKKFKATAEAHGLICEKDTRYGWTVTTLNDKAKELVAEMEKLEMFYINPVRDSSQESGEEQVIEGEAEEEQKPKKKRVFVFRCPVCGDEIKSKNPEGRYYDDCGELFERVD